MKISETSLRAFAIVGMEPAPRGRCAECQRRLTSVPADAAALPVANESAATESTAVTGGTAEPNR